MQLFSNKMKRVGNLPGIPVFIEYKVGTYLLDLPVVEEEAYQSAPHGVVIHRKNFKADPEVTCFKLQIPANWPKKIKLAEDNFEYKYCDAYELRRQFEAIDSPQKTRDFLGKCGPFRTYSDSTDDEFADLKFYGVSWAQVQSWQKYFADWKLNGFPNWVESGMKVSEAAAHRDFRWSIAPNTSSSHMLLEAKMHCSSAMHAIAATITLDILNGVTWRECAYCTKPFEMGHKVEKRFCDRDCKHRFGIRKSRAAAKTKRVKSKG